MRVIVVCATFVRVVVPWFVDSNWLSPQQQVSCFVTFLFPTSSSLSWLPSSLWWPPKFPTSTSYPILTWLSPNQSLNAAPCLKRLERLLSKFNEHLPSSRQPTSINFRGCSVLTIFQHGNETKTPRCTRWRRCVTIGRKEPVAKKPQVSRATDNVVCWGCHVDTQKGRGWLSLKIGCCCTPLGVFKWMNSLYAFRKSKCQ